MKRIHDRTINKPLWIIIAIMIVLVAILAAGMKRETSQRWSEQEQEWLLSTYGQFYALHRFYQQQFPNAKQEAWRNLKTDQPPFTHQRQHLLFIQDTDLLSQNQFEQLLQWIAQGNHVVMPLPSGSLTPSSDSDAIDTDDLDNETTDFVAANVVKWASLTKVPQRDWKKNPAPQTEACQQMMQNIQTASTRLQAASNWPSEHLQKMLNECNQNIQRIHLPEGKTIHYLADSPYSGFSIKPSQHLLWQSQGANGSHIARFAHGQGSLTLTTSMTAFGIPKDPRIIHTDLNRLDHAYLASYLAQDKTHIWFLQQTTAPKQPSQTSLWQKIWQFSPVLSVLILSLFALFVWRHAFRLGSIQVLSQHKQRQLSQYFLAQGEFLWRQKHHQHTLSQLQQSLWTHWQLRVPGLSLMDKANQLQALRQIYSVPDTDLKLWLQPIPHKFTAKKWLRYLQAYQSLRNAL